MGILKLFNPEKDEIWRQLSDEIGAKFIEGETWKGGKIVAKVDQWTLTLDRYRIDTQHDHIVYTRMRAPYVNPDGFRFNVYRKGLFASIQKFFGLQDVLIGFEEFDRDFIIQGNDEAKLKQLFSNAKIRELLNTLPSVYFEVKADEGWFKEQFPEGVDELYLLVEDSIDTIEQIKMIYGLFAETLHYLCHMGAAYEDDPHFIL